MAAATITRRAAVGLLFAAAACGGGSGSDDGGAAEDDAETSAEAPVATRPKPTAPSGTAAPASTTTDLLDRLPKAGDIGPLQLGIPSVAAIRSIALEFGSDPKGPCGATLTPLTLEGAAGRTYDMVNARIVGIGLIRDAATDTFVAENMADLTAGCPSHTTTLSDGSELTLSAPEAVDISAIAPEGLAWMSTIEQPAPEQHKATVVLPVTDLTIIVTMTSAEPIDPALLETIATIWTESAAPAA
jgi:hypothetical protein